MARVADRTAQLKTACGQNRIDPQQQHPNPTVAIVRARTSQRPRNHMHPLGCCRDSTPMNRTDIVETNKNTPPSKKTGRSGWSCFSGEGVVDPPNRVVIHQTGLVDQHQGLVDQQPPVMAHSKPDSKPDSKPGSKPVSKPVRQQARQNAR